MKTGSNNNNGDHRVVAKTQRTIQLFKVVCIKNRDILSLENMAD